MRETSKEPRDRSRKAPVRQTLLLDADDTLWENNIYFERAIASFISLLDHTAHRPEEVREHLNRVEHETIRERGYGTESFRISLVRCFEQLARTPANDRQHIQIMHFVDAIADAEIELISGVADALADLAGRHRLILVTKGNRLEQLEKLERSGLAPLFAATEVFEEKNVQAYLDVGHRHACEPRLTWMIGNSPKSDINPALAAGFNAVLIPHPTTWVLELEAVAEPQADRHLLLLQTLGELHTWL